MGIIRNFLIILFSLGSLQGASAELKNDPSVLKIHFTIADLLHDQSLKVNDVVKVLGYYSIDDGGAAEYIIKNLDFEEDSLTNNFYFEITNGLNALLLEPQTVNYKMFGAKGDGASNDAVQIAAAHKYANSKSIPVINKNGEFWLKEIEKIIIQTDVDWGNTIFHIDEKFNNLKEYRFEVTSKFQPKEINLSDKGKEELIHTLKPGVTYLSILESFKNHFILIADSNDRIGFRAGDSYNGQSWAKEDFFYLEESGKIIGDITWSFKDYTKLIAYPVDKNYLNLQGGTFYLSGDSPSSPHGYFKNGISINRSKTIISDQWVGLEPGVKDTTTLNPRSGFYSFSNVYDVTLQNVRLIPYQYFREDGKNVHSGTYGISMGRVLKSYFKKVTAEGSSSHWGVFGTNLNKDFRIEDCYLNRVDVHFHCWNLSIINSHIGDRGITVTGGGNLIIDNTTCSGQRFIGFRSDYGSRWEGNIKITNSVLKVGNESKNIYLLDFSPVDFDYKYPISFAKSIIIENFVIDFRAVENRDATCWLIYTPQFSQMYNGDRISLPGIINFDNIKVTGRDKGVRLFTLADQGGYRTDMVGGYDDGRLMTNASINFKNIQLENLSEQKDQFHFSMDYNKEAMDEFSFYPSIKFSDCDNIVINNQGNAANLFFERCTIANISGENNEPLKGRFIFRDSEFYPVIKYEYKSVYSLNATAGTFFSNCIIHLPVLNGERRDDLLDKVGFIKADKSLGFYHSNTVLNKHLIE